MKGMRPKIAHAFYFATGNFGVFANSSLNNFGT
jgi:hypothetical protein